jgi:hypothetical protein
MIKVVMIQRSRSDPGWSRSMVDRKLECTILQWSGRRLAWLACLAAITAVAGCGPARKAVYPVQGELRLGDGRPAAHAQITLHPVAAARDDVHPTGEVDDQGRFTLTTYAAGDGAPAGEYRIAIVWYLATGRDDETPQNYLPAAYARAESTPLPAVTIVKGPNHLPPIQLPAE